MVGGVLGSSGGFPEVGVYLYMILLQCDYTSVEGVGVCCPFPLNLGSGYNFLDWLRRVDGWYMT